MRVTARFILVVFLGVSLSVQSVNALSSFGATPAFDFLASVLRVLSAPTKLLDTLSDEASSVIASYLAPAATLKNPVSLAAAAAAQLFVPPTSNFATSQLPAHATTTIINQYITNPVIERTIVQWAPATNYASGGIDENTFKSILSIIQTDLVLRLSQMRAGGAYAQANPSPSDTFVTRDFFDKQTIATLDSIDNAAGGVKESIGESVGTDALTVSGASILGTLSAGASTLSSLTVSGDAAVGGTLTGTDLTLTGNLTVAGAQTLSGAITIPCLNATSTTQASTLPYASTTAITVSGTASTSNLVASNSFTFSNLTGFLKAVGGVVSTALVDLASNVTGILPVGNGGTGWASIAAGAIPYGNGASAFATTTAGTAGYVLAYLNGIPTWTATTTLSTISGTLAVGSGGTGATTFGQGWLYSNGGTGALAASTSPTVNYITATSTTATSTFAGALTLRGQLVAGLGAQVDNSTNHFLSVNNALVDDGTDNVLALQNLNPHRGSAVRFLSNTGDEKGAFGYANTQQYNELWQGTLFWENLNGAADMIIVGDIDQGAAAGWKNTTLDFGIYASSGSRHIRYGTQTFGVARATGNMFSLGNVGIGTTTPWGKLSVAALSSNTAPLFIISTSTASATSTAFYINQNGLVGIGSSSPATQLSVSGSGYLTGGLGVGVLNTTGGTLQTSGNTTIGGVAALNGTSGTTTIASGQAFTIGTSQFVLQQGSGNVGIGTASPIKPLHVVGSAFFSGAFTDPGGSNKGVGIGYDTTNGYGTIDSAFWGVANAVLAINSVSHSNVGIDKTTANSKLDVNGGVRAKEFIANATGALSDFSVAGDAGFYFKPDGVIQFVNQMSSAAADTVTLDSGKLGIGTTTPWAKLSVAGASNGTTPLFTISTSTASATSTAFLVDSNGLVGIAQTSPTYKLDVTGNGHFTTFLDAANFVATSTSVASRPPRRLGRAFNSLLWSSPPAALFVQLGSRGRPLLLGGSGVARLLGCWSGGMNPPPSCLRGVSFGMVDWPPLFR